MPLATSFSFHRAFYAYTFYIHKYGYIINIFIGNNVHREFFGLAAVKTDRGPPCMLTMRNAILWTGDRREITSSEDDVSLVLHHVVVVVIVFSLPMPFRKKMPVVIRNAERAAVGSDRIPRIGTYQMHWSVFCAIEWINIANMFSDGGLISRVLLSNHQERPQWRP